MRRADRERGAEDARIASATREARRAGGRTGDAMKLSALRYSLFAVRQKVVIASEDVSLKRRGPVGDFHTPVGQTRSVRRMNEPSFFAGRSRLVPSPHLLAFSLLIASC